MDDHLNSPRRYPPVNDPIVNDPLVTDTRPHLDGDLERDGSLWPFLALAALLSQACCSSAIWPINQAHKSGRTPNALR